MEKGEVGKEEEKEDKERQEDWRGEGEEEEDRLRRTGRKEQKWQKEGLLVLGTQWGCSSLPQML